MGQITLTIVVWLWKKHHLAIKNVSTFSIINSNTASLTTFPQLLMGKSFFYDINQRLIFIIELLGDILKQKPKETDGVESVIVVDGVPQVGPDRLEKLQNVIHKFFSKFGNVVNSHYPTNEKGFTKVQLHNFICTSTYNLLLVHLIGVHIFGVCHSNTCTGGCKSRQQLQARQAAHLSDQSLH